MSENSANEIIVNSDEVAQEGVVPQAVVDENISAETVVEQSETAEGVVGVETAVEAPANAQKKKVDVIDFLKTNIFTPKVAKISTLILGIVITVLSVLQAVMLILGSLQALSDGFLNGGSIKGATLLCGVLVIIFCFALLIKSIKSIVSIIKKGNHVRMDTIVTIFSYSLVSGFCMRMFGVEGKVFSGLSFNLLDALLILALIYSVFYFFKVNSKNRTWACIFCGLSFIVITLMSKFDIANFANFIHVGSRSNSISDYNAYNFLRALNNDVVSYNEYAFFIAGPASSSGISNEGIFLALFMELAMILISNIMPILALSLVGYLIYCITEENYIQYFNLENARKISVYMLVFSIINLVLTIAMMLWCEKAGCLVRIEIDYVNVVITLFLEITLIVFLAMPWKIYNITYKKLYEQYKQSEVNRKNGTTTM